MSHLNYKLFRSHEPERLWRSGDEKEDLRRLVDGAYTLVETKDVTGSPYNKRWKTEWLKRARELGAIPEL
jgi:hypothetical protein